MTTANDIMKIHKNKVPIIINLPDHLNATFTKTKFIVPNNLTVRQFHCILKKYTTISSKQSLILFVNKKLPMISDTIGNIYENEKSDNNFLYIDVQKENTFG